MADERTEKQKVKEITDKLEMVLYRKKWMHWYGKTYVKVRA